jgi:hypothetical protein
MSTSTSLLLLWTAAVPCACLCLVSCGSTADVPPVVTDVYVAGHVWNEAEIPVATVWTNGVATALTDGTYGAWANSLAVVGSEVYVVGSERRGMPSPYGGLHDVPTVWRNGVATPLTDGTYVAQASSVAVSGDDVYVVGYASIGTHEIAKGPHDVSVLWKNGVATWLTDGTRDAQATSVALSGSDVYVVGWDSIDDHHAVATVWKNGVATRLTNGARYAEAASVAVSGSDVYVVGHDGQAATIWKNEVVTALTDGSQTAYASSVAVSGSDVYVVGLVGEVAVAWRNGVALRLTDASSVTSVAVLGSDVYVGGSASNRATVWRNEVPAQLSPRSSRASSVFLHSH